MAYAFLLGLAFGFLRSRTGSILPGIAAHAAFNAMNDPLGLFGDAAESGYALAVMERCPSRVRAVPPWAGIAGGFS